MQGGARLWLVLWFLGCASSASAETLDPRAEATRLSDRGAEALKRQDPAAALLSFDAALRLFPSSKLHYNRGLALDALGRGPEAASAFERFLAEADDAPAAHRTYAQRRLGELEPLCGRVRVGVEPASATVTLDGQPLTAPATVRLAPGAHELVAQLANHTSARRPFVAVAGETADVTLRLVPMPAATAQAPSVPAFISRSTAPPEQVRTPLYRRWWLWTIVGGVVAAGVVATAVVLTQPAATPPRGSLGNVSPTF